MLCPFCKKGDDRVIDSRPLDNAVVIRRRRECIDGVLEQQVSRISAAGDNHDIRRRAAFQREQILRDVRRGRMGGHQFAGADMDRLAVRAENEGDGEIGADLRRRRTQGIAGPGRRP